MIWTRVSGSNTEKVKRIQIENKNSTLKYYSGIYSTPDPALAEEYATTFEYKGTRYKVLVQNRVNMEDTEVIKVRYLDHKGQYFVTANENNIRPYGLLFKKAD